MNGERMRSALNEDLIQECWWRKCGRRTRQRLPVGHQFNPLICPLPLCGEHIEIVKRKETKRCMTP